MNSPHPSFLPSLPLSHFAELLCVSHWLYVRCMCAKPFSLCSRARLPYRKIVCTGPLWDYESASTYSVRASAAAEWARFLSNEFRGCNLRLYTIVLNTYVSAPTFELSWSTYVCAWEYICWGEYLHTVNGFWTNNHLPSLYFKARRLVLAKVSRLLN